jgi:hypothetical protein
VADRPRDGMGEMKTVTRLGPFEAKVPAPKEIRNGGGVYVYRTRKPGSLFGLLWSKIGEPPWWMWPIATLAACLLNGAVNGRWWFGLAILLCTGRHFAYVGETVSFKDRHGEHINGGGRWTITLRDGRKVPKPGQPWSDLDAKCILRIPLPKWKWLLRTVETGLILFLFPVYNDKKNKGNLRRIPLRAARRQRQKRERRVAKRNLRINFNLSAAHVITAIAFALVMWIGVS